MIDVPSVLGGLLDGLSAALNQYENTRINNLPRMGDFCKWATAAGQHMDGRRMNLC